jgi:hypothetical protein
MGGNKNTIFSEKRIKKLLTCSFIGIYPDAATGQPQIPVSHKIMVFLTIFLVTRPLFP